MKKIIFLIFTLTIIILITGCGFTPSQITRAEYYPKMYKHPPVSILVLPAKNTTTAVNVAKYFSYTITQPLTEKGYYVFPVHLVDDFFKSENLPNAELIRKIPLNKLKKVFNADAILYVDINSWNTAYIVLGSHVDVGVSFSLVDANTGDELWNSNSYAYSYDGVDGNGSLLGLVVGMIAAGVNTSVDYTKLAYFANIVGLSFLPYGKYHPLYKRDANFLITNYNNFVLKDKKIYVPRYFIYGNEKKGKVPISLKGYAKGYHAFVPSNLSYMKHNGYENYYVMKIINGGKYLKNKFFKYENNEPYLFSNNKKVFVVTEKNGKIPFYKEEDKYGQGNDKYYFKVKKVIELKKIHKK
jgi:hypothetical protein